MLDIEKNVSVLVENQMPSFYKEEGQDFLAFIKAYFEYLEDNNNAFFKSRSLLNYRDIDSTLDTFVQSFVEKYLVGVPDTFVLQPTDDDDRKRFLIKHIFDLYRSKGTQRGYDLLFRLLFNETIEIDIPGDVLLKPSDGNFIRPAFLEVDRAPNLSQLVNQRVIGQSSQATALVEAFRKFFIDGREVNVLSISDLSGNFITGEYIFDKDKNTFNNAFNSPKVTGSMTELTVLTNSGGQNFNVGDVLQIAENVSGLGGTATVASLISSNGTVTFSIVDGGSGYIDPVVHSGDAEYEPAVVSVQSRGPVENTNITVLATNSQHIPSYPRYANGMLANTTLLATRDHLQQVVDGSASPENFFTTRIEAPAAADNEASEALDLTGDGSITSADVDAINAIIASGNVDMANNEQIGFLNFINTYYNITDLDDIYKPFLFTYSSTDINGVVGSGAKGFVETTSEDTGAVLTVGVLEGGTNTNCSNGSFAFSGLHANLIAANNWPVRHSNGSITTTIEPNMVVSFNGSGATFEIGRVENTEAFDVNTDVIGEDNVNGNPYTTLALDSGAFGFPGDPTVTRTSGTIEDAINYNNFSVGTIAELAGQSLGTGYSHDPAVKVTDSLVRGMSLPDGSGGIKGDNSTIITAAGNSVNSAASLAVVSSGLGYRDGDIVTLSNTNLIIQSSGANNVSEVTASVSLGRQGKLAGQWRGTRGLIDNSNRIQDSFFYQEFSYAIKSRRTLDKYKDIAKKVIHPAGIALFGLLDVRSLNEEEATEIEVATVTQV
jgi:hypothetical protein